MGKMLDLVNKIESFLAESDMAWSLTELHEEFSEPNDDIEDAVDILEWAEYVKKAWKDGIKDPEHTYYCHKNNF